MLQGRAKVRNAVRIFSALYPTFKIHPALYQGLLAGIFP
jgi:hypothetical protein